MMAPCSPADEKAIARGSSAGGTSSGTSACCAGIWKARTAPSTTDSASSSVRCDTASKGAAASTSATSALRGHAQRDDARAVVAVDHVAGHQHQRQRRQELQQAHQPQVPGRAGQVVHLPADGHHQHLAGGHAGQARPPQAHEVAAGQQFAGGHGGDHRRDRRLDETQ